MDKNINILIVEDSKMSSSSIETIAKDAFM